MTMTLRRRWREISQYARQEDEFSRTNALAMAVGCIERGLDALGIHRLGRQGVQARIQNSRVFDSKHAPDPNALRQSIQARNAAVHNHVVGDADECTKHISTLRQAWRTMQAMYVTKTNAADLARELVKIEGVSHVFLFGSLAVSGKRNPQDIDLLLFDDGEYSSLMSKYIGREAGEESFLATTEAQAASRCGWLDYLFVDGTRFGTDAEYTLGLAQHQHDPLFFVNIAGSLREFDPVSSRWLDKRPQVFSRLAALREQLAIENIVPRFPAAQSNASRPPTEAGKRQRRGRADAARANGSGGKRPRWGPTKKSRADIPA